MKKVAAIKLWEEKIEIYKSYIKFLENIPLGKMLGITYIAWRNINIRCLVEVIEFNKESLRVKLIAAEKACYPFVQGRGTMSITALKLKNIVDYTIKPINDDQLPIFVGFEVKTEFFDERMGVK